MNPTKILNVKQKKQTKKKKPAQRTHLEAFEILLLAIFVNFGSNKLLKIKKEKPEEFIYHLSQIRTYKVSLAN